MMATMINQKVVTPLGVGVVQGPRFGVLDGKGEVIAWGVLVRLAVDDATRKALKAGNCVTPTAKVSGLWVFREEELGEGGRQGAGSAGCVHYL
jgi:hypothetical protein